MTTGRLAKTQRSPRGLQTRTGMKMRKQCANTWVAVVMMWLLLLAFEVVPESEAFHHCSSSAPGRARSRTNHAAATAGQNTLRLTPLSRYRATSSSSSLSSSPHRPHHRLLVLLHMGLYDKPLPPRPPRNNQNENSKIKKDTMDENDDDEDDSPSTRGSSSSIRLFQVNDQGREVNDLLPALSRRLERGTDVAECCFEPTDRLVQNLVEKTSCHVDDACWALEACRGDITEAWTRISMARRLALDNNAKRSTGNDDKDLMDVQMRALFAQRKRNRLSEEKRRNALDFWKAAEPKNEQWTPGQSNPRPMDDEPWFTG